MSESTNIKAAAIFRDSSAYSSFRYSRQNSSVIPVTASYFSLIFRGTLCSFPALISIASKYVEKRPARKA